MQGVRGDYLEDGFPPQWIVLAVLTNISRHMDILIFLDSQFFFFFLFYLLNYQSIITHLQKTWKIQNKVTYSCTMCVHVQSPSHVWLFSISWTAAHQASLPFTISLSLLRLMSIELMILSNRLILCHPLLLQCLFSSHSINFWELDIETPTKNLNLST